jgi:hypothetical protein
MKNLKFKLLTALLITISLQISAREIWVSPSGSDNNPGTKEQPMANIDMALRKARELRRLSDPSMVGGIHIIITDGIYYLKEPLLIRPEDSGTSSSPTFIEAAPGAKPVISGGIEVSGWRKTDAAIQGLPADAIGKIWETDAPRIGGRLLEFRQLWVNNVKATRASDYNEGKLQRILSVDKKNQILWIPKSSIVTLKDAGSLELFIHQWWAIAILRVKSIDVIGDSAGFTFQQP